MDGAGPTARQSGMRGGRANLPRDDDHPIDRWPIGVDRAPQTQLPFANRQRARRISFSKKERRAVHARTLARRARFRWSLGRGRACVRGRRYFHPIHARSFSELWPVLSVLPFFSICRRGRVRRSTDRRSSRTSARRRAALVDRGVAFHSMARLVRNVSVLILIDRRAQHGWQRGVL